MPSGSGKYGQPRTDYRDQPSGVGRDGREYERGGDESRTGRRDPDMRPHDRGGVRSF